MGRIPHSFHRSLHQTLGWVCTVYCSLDILLLVTLRMALNQTHERGSKAQVHDVRVSLLAFSAEGLERQCLRKTLSTDASIVCSISRVP